MLDEAYEEIFRTEPEKPLATGSLIMDTEQPAKWQKKVDELFEWMGQKWGDVDIRDLEAARDSIGLSLIFYESIPNSYPKVEAEQVAEYVASHLVASLNLGRLLKEGKVSKRTIDGRTIYRAL
jgi:hypothetical protein